MAIKDKPKLKQFLVNILRRASYRYPGRYQAMKRAKIGYNQYYCENPECGLVHGRKDGAMDHIDPVVDPKTGWIDLDTYAERMFVSEDGYQRLCNRCHDEKTEKENAIRKEKRLDTKE